MHPFLREGDWIGVDWEAAEASEGELVLGRDGDRQWVVHRVVARASERMITKGDAAFVSDGESRFWGKVVAFRGSAPGSETAFNAGLLDRWIARLSRGGSRIGRKLIFALGNLRRRML